MLLYDVLGDNDPKTLLDLFQNELITWASWKGLTYTAHACAVFFGCLDTDASLMVDVFLKRGQNGFQNQMYENILCHSTYFHFFSKSPRSKRFSK